LCLDQEIFSNSEGKLPRTAQLRRLIRDKDFYSGEFDQHTSTIDEVPESSPIKGYASQKNGSEIEPYNQRRTQARCETRFGIRAKDHTQALCDPEGSRQTCRTDARGSILWPRSTAVGGHKFFPTSGLEGIRFRTKVYCGRGIADFSATRKAAVQGHGTPTAAEFVQRRHDRSFSCER